MSDETPTVETVVTELQSRDATAALLAQCPALEARLATYVEEADQIVATRVAANGAETTLAQLVAQRTDAQGRAAETWSRIKADPHLTPSGKAAKSGEVHAALDAGRAQILDAGQRACNAIRALSPGDGWGTELRASWLPEFQLLQNSFGIKAPTTWNAEAFDALQLAMNPTASAESRAKANRMLEQVYRPGLERRAAQPERFALAAQPASAQLLQLVDQWLDVARGGVLHRAYNDVADRLFSELRGVDLVASQGHFDPTMIQVSAPTLYAALNKLPKKS